ncbi:transcriptional repressor NrdR [Candidatus Roizmanbacteria bacterium]|nr:transcriptional repressor NrdR [Candidatus Roizmanbacteria bacterium]
MHCYFCKHTDTEVIETRITEDGTAIRRRRQCPQCQKRFTTYERTEELPLFVTKRDKRRERFSREKLRNGILHAVEKTTVSPTQIELIVSEIEIQASGSDKGEIESNTIGDMVANRLKELDKVAYIRFASVFRRFVDVEDFGKEVKKLQK